MLVGDALDSLMVEEKGGILGGLHVELDKGLRAEGGVGGDGDAALLGELDERLLGEVWVVLDLEGSWVDLGVAEEVKDKGAVVVGDTDALCKAVVDQLLHRLPGVLQWCVALGDLVVLVGPAWWVADRRVDILDGDGEVNDVQVEVVKTPVLELLLADGLDALWIVERVPELGDEEEVLTLDDAFLDGAGNTLAGLLLVAVVWTFSQ